MRDESVTFSLRELEKLENERIDKEKREALAAIERAEREAADARRREADALAAREEKERVARLAEIELESKREAQARAAVEQARIEVEARTRSQDAEAERRHEIELARIKTEGERKTPFGLVVASGSIGALLAVAACAGAYFGVTRPAIDRSMASLEAVAQRANEHAQAVEKDRAADQKKISDLQLELRDAKQQIASMEANKPPVRSAPVDPPWKPGPGGKTPGTKPDTTQFDACKGNPDPLCGIGKH